MSEGRKTIWDGSKNPEYLKYIRSTKWAEKARQRRDLDHDTCQVCGRSAESVHHLTYDHLFDEPMDDLVSLCNECHQMAENLYDPAITPWTMGTKAAGNFMAAMRLDASLIAQEVFKYLRRVIGASFTDLLWLRQPIEGKAQSYWARLRIAVNALCKKRYSLNMRQDRIDMAMGIVSNHVCTVCLAQIEHEVRNHVQRSLCNLAHLERETAKTWTEVADRLGIKASTLQKIKSDDGSSYGPTLREAVMYYCGLDAAAGIGPIPELECLSDEDRKALQRFADYQVGVTIGL